MTNSSVTAGQSLLLASGVKVTVGGVETEPGTVFVALGNQRHLLGGVATDAERRQLIAMLQATLEPRFFHGGEECPEVGTRIVDAQGERWEVKEDELLISLGVTRPPEVASWTTVMWAYAPVKEVL